MNYEEKYTEALERAKLSRLQLLNIGEEATEIEYIFPELRESEDERIRNFLIKQANSVLESITDDDEEVPAWKSALSWLEKQGEQNYSWSEEDKEMLDNCLGLIQEIDSTQEEQNWLKSLKPNHWKPSEQNLKDLEWCADLVKDKMGVGFNRLQVFIDEIKTL